MGRLVCRSIQRLWPKSTLKNSQDVLSSSTLDMCQTRYVIFIYPRYVLSSSTLDFGGNVQIVGWWIFVMEREQSVVYKRNIKSLGLLTRALCPVAIRSPSATRDQAVLYSSALPYTPGAHSLCDRVSWRSVIFSNFFGDSVSAMFHLWVQHIAQPSMEYFLNLDIG